MADPESQTMPFASTGVRSDEQPPTTTAIFRKRKHQESSKCPVYVLAAVVLQGTVILIFASVFLRVINPKLRLSSVSIQNLQYQNVNSTSLNMTVFAEGTVDNQNFGRYVFDSCSAVVLYGNTAIGGGDISGGRVGARKSKSISFVMRVGSENLNFSSGGTEVMEIISYAKMTGIVDVMKIVDRRKTIEMNCTMNLNLRSRTIMDLLCR